MKLSTVFYLWDANKGRQCCSLMWLLERWIQDFEAVWLLTFKQETDIWRGNVLNSPFSEISLIFPSLQDLWEKNGLGKWFFGNWIYSLGDNGPTWPQNTIISPFSGNIHDHCIGEFNPDHSNTAKFSPPHPHVFFPL